MWSIWVGVGLVFAAIGLVTALSKSATGTKAVLILLSLVGGGALHKVFEPRPELGTNFGPLLCAMGGGFIIGLVGGVVFKGVVVTKFPALKDEKARGIIGAVLPKVAGTLHRADKEPPPSR